MAWLPIHESSPQCLRDVRSVLSGLGRGRLEKSPLFAALNGLQACASGSSLEQRFRNSSSGAAPPRTRSDGSECYSRLDCQISEFWTNPDELILSLKSRS